MTTNQIQVGSKIQRISNNYTGDVIEIDSINRRARIVWGEGMPRTWIRFADLLVIAETKPTLTSSLSPFDRGELGQHLWDLRQAAGIKSIRDAEELSGVSNAYISQIETGRIKKPSPDILDRLANAYKGSYEKLMELAGHIKPASATGKRRGRLPTFAKQDLTDEEESALLEYLAFLRIRRGRDKSEKG